MAAASPAAAAASVAPQPEVTGAKVMEFRSGKKQRAKVLAICDTGGQPVFATLQDLMAAAGGTCYVQVCNLVALLNPDSQQKTVRDIADRLNAVTVHADGAPVLIVGTRKGQVEKQGGAGALRQIDKLLRSHLSKKCPAFRSVVYDGELCFFGVENERGFKDETIQRLATAIDRATAGLPIMQRRVPAAWVRAFDELRHRLDGQEADGRGGEQQQKQQLISLAEVSSIAAQCGLPTVVSTLEREVRMLLQFLHSIGAVLWFDEPVLRDLVILDAQWVIDGVSCVIRNFELDDHKMACDQVCIREHEEEWVALKRDARLHTVLLPVLWGADGGRGDSKVKHITVTHHITA
mgnify:FL=1